MKRTRHKKEKREKMILHTIVPKRLKQMSLGIKKF